MAARKKYIKTHVKPFKVDPRSDVAGVLEQMAQTGFQGKNLGRAVSVWASMLKGSTTIFFGLAGAMVPAGMRNIVVYLIKNRLIDCVVSTGANLFHDIHETVGRFHWQGSHEINDNELKDLGIDRIYDVLAVDKEFLKTDRLISSIAASFRKKPYSTREFLYLFGGRLNKIAREEGILTAAYKEKVPVYCPALSDSGIGISLMLNKKNRINFDILADIAETGRIVKESRSTGVIYVGGGVPKNFIQQTEITAPYLGGKVEGHKYAVQFTTDAPHWGGLSGCTFEEGQSWGKVAKKAEKAMVFCDATIALPLVVTALAQSASGLIKRRKRAKLSVWQESKQ